MVFVPCLHGVMKWLSWSVASQLLPIAGPVMGLQPLMRRWTLVLSQACPWELTKRPMTPKSWYKEVGTPGGQGYTPRFAVIQHMVALYTSMAMGYKFAALSFCMGPGLCTHHRTGDWGLGTINCNTCIPYTATSGLFFLKHAFLSQELSNCQL